MRKSLAWLTMVSLLAISCATQGVATPNPDTTATHEPTDTRPREDALVSTTPVEGNTEGVEAQASVIIRFVSYGIEAYEERAQAFHEMYPHIRIELVSADDVMGEFGAEDAQDVNQTESLYRLLSAADTVATGAADLTSSIIKQGWVRDLAPFVETDADFAPEDYYPATMEAYQRDGGLWGIPASASLQVLLYDKRAFDEVALAYPYPDWDFDGFATAAERLTRRQESDVRYGYAVPGFWPSAPSIFVAGMADLVTRDAQGYEVPKLDGPDVIQAVQRYTDLALVRGVMPARTSISATADVWIQEWLEPRRVAMFPSSALNASLFADFPRIAAGFASEGIGIALYPAGCPILRVSGYSISGGTQYPAESWLWLKYLSRNYQGYHLPARRSVAAAQGTWARWDQEQQKMLQFALQNAPPAPSSDSSVIQELDAAIDAIFGGQAVEEALRVAQARALERYRAEVRAEPRTITLRQPELGREDTIVIEFGPFVFDPAMPYAPLAMAFNEEQARIGGQIRVEVSDDLAAPDCFAGPQSLVRDDAPANRGLRPLALQPLLEADTTLDLSVFYFVDAFRDRGELYGLPVLAQPEVLFYDRTLFDEAGIAYPAPDWTLDDFRRVVQELTSEQRGQYGFVPLNGAGIDLPLFTALYGAELWDTLGNPRFDSPEVIEAVAWYAELIEFATPSSMIVPTDETLVQRQTLLTEGRAAVWSVLVNAGVPTVRAPWTDAQVGMAPFPGTSARMGLEGLFINANAPRDRIEGCWAWIKYAAANRTVAPQQGIPARKATSVSPADSATQTGQSVAETYSAIASYTRLEQPNTIQAQAHLDILYDALASIMDGAPVEAALSAAQQRAQKH